MNLLQRSLIQGAAIETGTGFRASRGVLPADSLTAGVIPWFGHHAAPVSQFAPWRVLILVPALEPYLLIPEYPELDRGDSQSQGPLCGIVLSAVPPLNVKLARILTTPPGV